jgi:hypothetical protein
MTTKPAVFACAVLLLASGVSPAPAGQGRHGHGHWRATRDAIYELENRIAFLEADPEIDDGYKAPIITAARGEIRRLHATLPPAQWRWTAPCCYGRRPVHIR